MKPAILRYLRCPGCGSELSLKIYESRAAVLRDDEREIILKRGGTVAGYEIEALEGVLSCLKCPARFPVSGGVPRLYGDAIKDYPVAQDAAGPSLSAIAPRNERHVQTSFSREWDEFDYKDKVIWQWKLDDRVETFCEEIGITSPEEIRGRLMVDAGCGSGILSMTLAERHMVEIIAFDLSHAVSRAASENRSNLCHFVQASAFAPPIEEGIADITYSHGVLHHTYDTRKAFDSIAKLTRQGGLLYVWLYGKKRGWDRFRHTFFFRPMRTIISRLPRHPQAVMVYVMALIHLASFSLKKLLGMRRGNVMTVHQLLVGMRDKYTPLYAREHTEAEVIGWFKEAGYTDISRRTLWEKTKIWAGSTNLAIKGTRL